MPSFPLRLPIGQCLGEFGLKLGPPLLERAIKEIIAHVKTTFFVGLQPINIAVFKYAGRKCQLPGTVVDKERAFDEFAIVKARENDLASKIEMLRVKTFVPYDALFGWSLRAHCFAFSASVSRASRSVFNRSRFSCRTFCDLA